MEKDLADNLAFPEQLPDAAKISEQVLIRKFESTVLHSNGDVLMMSTDDARRIYEILANQCESDNTVADELDMLEEKIQDQIDRIAAVLPDDFELPTDAPEDKPSTLPDLAVLSNYVDALTYLFEKTKSTNITVEQERDSVTSEKQSLTDAIGRSAAGHIVTLSVKKEPKKA